MILDLLFGARLGVMVILTCGEDDRVDFDLSSVDDCSGLHTLKPRWDA
jgi:hypothetical protein